MLISMTGFGRGEFLSEKYSLKTEIKTVNHRYNDISIRLPRHLNFLEDKIKREVKKYINRGKVDIYINLEYLDEKSLKINLDLPLAKEIHRNLDILKDELNLNEDIHLSSILKLGDVFSVEREELSEDLLWKDLKESLTTALDDIYEMRRAEGENLRLDMVEKINKIESLVKEIEKSAPKVVAEYKEKLETRINELLPDGSLISEEKLAEEVAFFSDKSNIDEEITRFGSHIKQYLKIMGEKEPVGRKLDFLIQEMNREVNTIGSKTGDVIITNHVVEIKSEIEKLREQVQNIE